MPRKRIELEDGTVLRHEGWVIFDKDAGEPRRGDRWTHGMYPEIYLRKQDAEYCKYRGDTVKRVWVEE